MSGDILMNANYEREVAYIIRAIDPRDGVRKIFWQQRLQLNANGTEAERRIDYEVSFLQFTTAKQRLA